MRRSLADFLLWGVSEGEEGTRGDHQRRVPRASCQCRPALSYRTSIFELPDSLSARTQ